MKRLTVVTLIIVAMICLAAYAQIQTADPNSIADSNSIKLPEGAKMPVKLKCPVHGIIGKAFIAIETDIGTRIYCSQCAKTFVAKVFDLNLPKLEVLK